VVRVPSLLAGVLLLPSLALAAGTQFSTFLGGKSGEFASAVTTDSAGNIYATGQTSSPDFPVTPGAAQTTFGGGSDVFIAKFSPDGVLVWCTFFGGSGGDGARGIGVDAAGNVIVAGQTDSLNLPTVNALSPSLDNGHLRAGLDAFVVKVTPDGAHFSYATYLGGSGNDYAWALAVDAAGNAYVTGDSGPAELFPGPDGTVRGADPFVQYGFVVKLSPEGRVVFTSLLSGIDPRGIALDRGTNVYLTGASQYIQHGGISVRTRAVVCKLSPDGSTEVFRSFLGGSMLEVGTAIAVDGNGSAWITGMTGSGDLPLVRPLQTNFGARSLWRSTDSAATWSPIDNTPFGQVSATLVDSGALYVASPDAGLWVTSDGGNTWRAAGNGLPSANVHTLLRDPASGALFAATDAGLFQSTDSAQNWTEASSSPPHPVFLLAADPVHPGTLYATGGNGLFKSTDDSASWVAVSGCLPCTRALGVDPATGNVFAATEPPFSGPFAFAPPPPKSVVYRSTDGGATWSNDNNVTQSVSSFLFDTSTQPSTIYAGLTARSDDGGATWTRIATPPGSGLLDNVALDPATGALYAGPRFPESRLYASNDRGATWQPAAGSPPFLSSVIPAAGALYVYGGPWHTSAFVAKLSTDGGSWLLSSYLGGHAADNATQASAGGTFYTSTYWQTGTTYAEGIAIDADGNVVIAGATRSTDFTAVDAIQSANANLLDNFVTVLSPDGGAILYSTYLGGSSGDSSRAVAIDPSGAIVIVGQTYSDDFPTLHASQPSKKPNDDAFLVKLTWR
jgi:photosystem II stability/assembly factor-like uncharacterized protein